MRSLPALLLSLAASPALAGGGPENILLIANPASPEALRLTNHYVDVRGVPASNVLYMAPDTVTYAEFVDVRLPALMGELAARGIEDHIDFILVMPDSTFRLDAPDLISDVCPSPIEHLSTTAGYSSAFTFEEITAGGLSRSWPNRYAAGATNPIAFDSEVTYSGGQPSESSFARRYFISFMLGYTRTRGNSVSELIDLIDRSAAADGTFPFGTFYLMNNSSDPARNVRSTQYGGAETRIKEAGGIATILAGPLPAGRHDCLGIVSGFDNDDIVAADMTLLAGSFCDHLTSYAAHFTMPQQMKVSAWIEKGASGSFGTVEEPCNQVSKFPRANMHATYRAGLCLGESAFRSLFWYPFQGLFYGDPLTRPWAHIPSVSAPDLPAGPVSGSVTITPMATTTHPTAGIESFDLLVNGVLADSVAPGGSFTIDTTNICEGDNTLTIIAYEDTPIRTVGSLTASLDVDNLPQDVSLDVSQLSGDRSTRFDFTIGATGAPVTAVRLLHNSRVVAASNTTGTLSIHARLLGSAEATLFAEIDFSDGTTARTPPITLQIDNAAGSPGAFTPVAYSHTKTMAPDSVRVVELPSTFADDLDDATWTVLTPPAQATILGSDTGPWRTLRADAGAAGTDSMTFQVSTPSGTSATATVTIVYDSDEPCPADLAEPFGVLDFSDVLAFLTAFGAMDPAADLADPVGTFDFSDVIEFLVLFGGGCP